MHLVLIGLAIFCLRIGDVTVGTIRVIYTIRGRRLVAACLGVVESCIWILAISRALTYLEHNPFAIIGWATGFGAGTAVGITVERWIASGSILMRIISVEQSEPVRESLLQSQIGVTVIPALGRSGDVSILFVVAARKRGDELLGLVRNIDPGAFITIDPIMQAIGGYVPIAAEGSGLRK